MFGPNHVALGDRVTETLNASETMRLLRIGRETLAAMLDSGELTGFVKGKVIRIDRRSVERLLGRSRAQEPAPAA
jgi:hypothetical protein